MQDVTVDLQKINTLVSGSILRRLERSQYYVERFQQDSKALRARRIEGFQLYSEFVNRRMGATFGYIQYLRSRMDSIYAGMSALSRSYSALKIASVTASIDKLLGSMTNQNAEIRKIQDFGEVALIGFLIPYYVGTLLLEHVSHVPQYQHLGLVWPALISAFVIWVLSNQRKPRDPNRTEEPAEKERRVFVRKVFWGYFIVIWAAYLASWLLSAATAEPASPPGEAANMTLPETR
jgi:uncharacterized membrane-anchored protein